MNISLMHITYNMRLTRDDILTFYWLLRKYASVLSDTFWFVQMNVSIIFIIQFEEYTAEQLLCNSISGSTRVLRFTIALRILVYYAHQEVSACKKWHTPVIKNSTYKTTKHIIILQSVLLEMQCMLHKFEIKNYFPPK